MQSYKSVLTSKFFILFSTVIFSVAAFAQEVPVDLDALTDDAPAEQIAPKEKKAKEVKEKTEKAVKEEKAAVEETVTEEVKAVKDKAAKTSTKATNTVNNETSNASNEATSVSATAENAVAEVLNPLKFKKAKKAGFEAMDAENYNEAAEMFMAAFNAKPGLKPKQYDMAYQAGVATSKLRDYKGALALFQMVAERDSTKDKKPQAEYMAALMTKQLGMYPEAISMFNDFSRSEVKASNLEALDMKRDARREKQGCEEAIALMDKETDFKVALAEGKINSPNNDYAAFYMNDNTALFTSYTNDKDYNAPSKILMSSFYNDEWTEASDISLTDNEGNLRIESGYYNEETSELFFSKCKKIEGNKICNIFVSKYEGGSWQDVRSVGDKINSITHSSKDPVIGKDLEGNTVMYFASNADRSRGGYDIWYSIRDENGEFGRIKNLGFPFNTDGDEVSPFFDEKNNTLYFSSNGHVTVGGFDVLKASFTAEDGWSETENMGFPINSSADDYYFSLDKNGRKGFLASNRMGGNSLANETCCDDIYSVRMRDLELAVEGQVFFLFDGREEIVKTSGVKLLDREENRVINSMERNEGESFFFTLTENKDYELISSVQNFGDVMKEISTKGLVDDDTISIKIVHTEIKDWKGYTIGIIYFDYNTQKLRDDAPQVIQEVINFMKEHEDLVMEVSGHTDNKGSDVYNQRLSENRAKAVKQYLVSKDLSGKRIITMGYGESKPLVKNENEDGSDNPEGRSQNRRVEFIVIGTIEK